MGLSIYIIHTTSDSTRTEDLLKYLLASSDVPVDIRCSSLPGYGVDLDDADSDELKSLLYQSDTIIALVTEQALTDPQFNLELGAAMVLGVSFIPLIDPTVQSLPPSLHKQNNSIILDNPHAVIDLAKSINEDYIESEQALTALNRIFCKPQESAEIEPAEEPSKEDKPITLQGLPAVLPDAILTDEEQKDSYPSALEAVKAGLAYGEYSFSSKKGNHTPEELENFFGRFINSLGGNWKNLRELNDLEVWEGAVENLFGTLPGERKSIALWFEMGMHLATMLCIAEQDKLQDSEQKNEFQELWSDSLEAFQLVARAMNLDRGDLDQMGSMLENLIGDKSTRDEINIAKSQEMLLNCAKRSM